MPYPLTSRRKKIIPGIKFYPPAQIAYELAVAEHKRIRMHPENITDCYEFFMYYWGIILAIITDPAKSMRLPEESIVNEYKDLLFKGSSFIDPVNLDDDDLPGLSALLPIATENPVTVSDQPAREMKRLWEITNKGKVQRVGILSNSTWERYKSDCIRELFALTMQIKTLLQMQLKADPNIKQEDFEYIRAEVDEQLSE